MNYEGRAPRTSPPPHPRSAGSAPAAPLARCLAVWLGVSAGVALMVGSLSGDVIGFAEGLRAAGRPVDFELLLGGLASVVLVGCAAWLWAVTTVVTVQAARGGAALRRPVPGCPGVVRRWVLVACGVAVVSGLAAPAATASSFPIDHGSRTVASHDAAQARRQVAHASTARTNEAQTPSLSGLPLPDRITDPDAEPHPHQHPGRARPRPVGEAHRPALPGTVLVREGDSLWSLAAATLPDGASNTEIAHRWHRLYALNRHLIGSDPDLILAGRTLSVPTWGEETAR